MISLRKEDREIVKQIDLIEQQHGELCREFAELKGAFEKLRQKKREIVKQIDNMLTTIEEKHNEQ